MLRALLVLCMAGFIGAASAQNDSAMLDGVLTAANGAPATNALVVIFSASPRDGRPGTRSALHYPDCGKHTRTDAQGHFVLKPVDKELLFRLLISAPGHAPDYIRDADPQFGGLALKLKARRGARDASPPSVFGKLLAPDGNPVIGARVTADMARAGTTTYSSLNAASVDPFTVTDEEGLFRLACTNRYPEFNVIVDAPHLAKRRMWLDVGKAHLIRLRSGVAVSGRVQRDGNPMPHLLLTLSTERRAMEFTLRGLEVATDAQGRFTLAHVPADSRFLLHTKMNDTTGLGAALLAAPVNTGPDGSTLQLDELALTPTATLRGRVLLADGQPVPRRTSITLQVERTTDSVNAILDPDGWFEFMGVPKDTVVLRLRIPGYRLSAKNPNKDWLNEDQIVGQLTQNHDELFIDLERAQGPVQRNRTPGATRSDRNKPLQGAKL
jgi:hypothetical protein